MKCTQLPLQAAMQCRWMHSIGIYTSCIRWDNEKVRVSYNSHQTWKKWFSAEYFSGVRYSDILHGKEKRHFFLQCIYIYIYKDNPKARWPDWWLSVSFQNCLAALWNRPFCGYSLPTCIGFSDLSKGKKFFFCYCFVFYFFLNPDLPGIYQLDNYLPPWKMSPEGHYFVGKNKIC